MTEYYRLTDSELRTWLNQFRDGATAYSSSLGLTAPDIAAIDNAAAEFGSALDTQDAAQLSAKSATQFKANTRKASSKTVAKFANAFRANVAVSDEILVALGLPPHGGSPLGPVTPPLDLKVTVSQSGVNTLKWKRNGNPYPASMFRVEARTSTSAPWAFVGGGTGASFAHTDQTPGVTVFYRVATTRDGQVSDFSNIAVAYGQGDTGSGDNTITLAA